MTDNLTSPIKKNILVIGDIMLDHTIVGTVNRISPEAPVPVLLEKSNTLSLGGAGKTAELVAKSQHTNNIWLFGMLGRAQTNEWDDYFKSRGIDFLGVIHADKYTTTTKTRFITNQQQVFRYDKEMHRTLSLTEIDLLVDTIKTRKIDAIVISDYNKGVLSPIAIESILNESSNKHIPVFVDPKKNYISSYNSPFLVKFNYKEFIDYMDSLKIPNHNRKDFEYCVKYASECLNCGHLIITRGSESVVSVSKISKSSRLIDYYYVANKLENVNPVGAGDCFLAELTIGFLLYDNIKSAIAYAMEGTSNYLQGNKF